ncbi:TIR domain-containing protein [Arthrobacter sp. BE255]|uniref:TIR domain-containing protein n=1 Tax=Arthrobacter sp. BE255 TaxID=2817721 RepID=UPI0037BF6590
MGYGRPRDSKGLSKSLCRQNVILELGYFFGKLGRKKAVCKLQLIWPIGLTTF